MKAAGLVVSLVWGLDPDAPIAGSLYLQLLEILMNAHTTFLVASLAACVSVSISAQTATTVPGATTATSAKPSTNYRGLRASAIIGKAVRNPEGTNLGEINDLIVDMNTGDVRYAILEFDLGIFQGERLFAVPTNQLRMAADREELVYNMTRDTLERTAVNRADWNQTWRDPNYLANLDKTWGVVQPSRSARAHRVSDLLNQDVKSRQGNKIGEIEELVINMANQKVHYAVLEFDRSWAAPEEFYAFPVSAFNQTGTSDDLVLDVDRSKLQAMKAFPEDRYTSLNDPAWVADVDRNFATMRSTARATRTGQTGDQSARISQPGRSSDGSQEVVAVNSPLPPRTDRN